MSVFIRQMPSIVFNQKVRDAQPGAKGKLAGIVKSSVLVEVDGKFVTVSNRLLDRITVCQPREILCRDWRPAASQGQSQAGVRRAGHQR